MRTSVLMRCLPLLMFCWPTSAFSQNPFAPPPPRSDTLAVDSLAVAADTTEAKGIDTVVTYTCADSIVYSARTRTMEMYGKGNIKYQRMDLKSERIDLNWNTSTLAARGVPDSTADSAKGGNRGLPVMKDGGEEYKGMELGYNFKTKKGRVNLGNTQMDQGYYHGQEIKKVEPDVLFVENGRYTTCEIEEPHYYFGSPKMKIVVGDKIVAQPVYLYIDDVPVFWLPEAVFPARGGRRSGIIAPALVEDATYGRLLHHLGYYWALNDHMDVNLRTDLYTKGSWGLASDFRYAKRYDFTGSLSGQYSKRIKNESSDPDYSKDESYQFNITHNQTFDPTTRLNVYFTFATNNSYLNTINQQQLLNQSITSNATLSKSWEGTPNSVTINVSRTQDLRNGNISETLPSLSFNHSQSYPFRFGNEDPDFEDAAWYENIAFNYGANLSNNRSKIQTTITDIDTTSGVLSASEYQINRSRSLNQSVGLSISPKLGYVTVSPFASYIDQRTFSENDVPLRVTSDGSIVFATQEATRRYGAISSGVSMSTKFYGIMQPGILGIEAFRHTVTPSLSFSYNKQIIGDDLPPKQMLMAFNVGNVFEMKTVPEEGKDADRIQLLNLNAGVSYNFSADSLNFSEIPVSFRTGIGDLLNLYGGAGFDLYKFANGGRINEFSASGGPLLRLTNFSVDVSTTLAGEKHKGAAPQPEASGDSALPAVQGRSYYGLYREEDPDFSIPWRLSVSMNYSENLQPGSEYHASSIHGNLEFNLTDAWKFTMSGGYDIVNKEVVVPNIMISRDLHCWLMNFTWIPLGNAKSFQFEIRVKAPQLKDLKLTKSGSATGYYR